MSETAGPCDQQLSAGLRQRPTCKVRPAPSVDGRPSGAELGITSSDDRDAASTELRAPPRSKLTRDVFSRELLHIKKKYRPYTRQARDY